MKQGNLTWLYIQKKNLENRYQPNQLVERRNFTPTQSLKLVSKDIFFYYDLLSEQIPIESWLSRSSMIIIAWCRGWVMTQQWPWCGIKCFPLCSYDNRARGRVPGWLLIISLCRRMGEGMPAVLALNWWWCLLIPALVLMLLRRRGGFLFRNVTPVAWWRRIFHLQHI